MFRETRMKRNYSRKKISQKERPRRVRVITDLYYVDDDIRLWIGGLVPREYFEELCRLEIKEGSTGTYYPDKELLVLDDGSEVVYLNPEYLEFLD